MIYNSPLQRIQNALEELQDACLMTGFDGGIEENRAAVHCDEVYWRPATDEYLVQVAKANSAELTVYLRDELSRQGYETEVITDW